MRLYWWCFFLLLVVNGCSDEAAMERDELLLLCPTYCSLVVECGKNSPADVANADDCTASCIDSAQRTDDLTCLGYFKESMVCAMELTCEQLLNEMAVLQCIPEEGSSCFEEQGSAAASGF